MILPPELALSVGIRKGTQKLDRVKELLRTLPEPVLVFYEGAHAKKERVRAVIHYQTPASLEQYVREASLASDQAVLLFDPADLVIHHRRSMRAGSGGDRRDIQLMESYAKTRECRVQFIRRRLFGDTDVPRCGLCDRCRELRFVEAHHPHHR